MTEIDLLVKAIRDIYPLHQAFLDASIARMDGQERREAQDYIAHCLRKGLTIDALARAYVKMMQDMMGEQLFFQRNGHYRFSTFAEIDNAVYQNAEYMREYIHALGVSTFLWPNHRDMLRFFKEVLPKQCFRPYLEIGPGHGFFMKSALELAAFSSYRGVDISATSLEITKALIEDAVGGSAEKRWTLEMADILEYVAADTGYGAIVMGEVLEHVEKPEKLLAALCGLADSDTFIFITTCINSPAPDHIYLDRNAMELETQVMAAGLRVCRSLYLPYFGKTLEESQQRKLPINVAMQLARDSRD